MDMEEIPTTTEVAVPILTASEIQQYLDECEAEFAATLAAVPAMRTLQVHQTGQGIALTVVSVSYGHADEATVLNGTAKAEEVVLTADGRSAYTHAWHEGAPTSDEWVYYERWTQAGRVAHGYVDQVTRKLVQVG